MRRLRRFEHPLLVLALVACAGLLVYNNILWRWDYLIYDAQLSLWSRPAADDIIIIEIDDQSLNDIGKWPWSREVHARLINQVQREQPAAIGLDLILSEPDNYEPQSDELLSEAIKNSDVVTLPVYMTRRSRGGVPIEALPIPAFTRHAAALGHVHVDTSQDGVVRRVYLWEGIGKPQWMHFSLALLNLLSAESVADEYAFSPEKPQGFSPMVWSREQPMLIPFAGPAGHFPSIGYSQVLQQRYPENLFHNKLVLIGATAEGLGDSLPIPLSGTNGSMPGVEIIANIYDALKKGLRIDELGGTPLVVLSMLLVAIPIVIYPFINPAATMQVLFGSILLTVTIIILAMWLLALWIPASTILLFQLLSYPLWSWRRLVLAMRHVNQELDYLLQRQAQLSLHQGRNLDLELDFISQFVPLSGWVVFNAHGRRIMQRGEVPVQPAELSSDEGWKCVGQQCWANSVFRGQAVVIGIKLKSSRPLDNEQLRLLNNLIPGKTDKHNYQAKYLTDVLRSRIQQVQKVALDYERLQRILEDSLSGMAEGVIISDSHGQVMFSNRRASWYLYGDDEATIIGRSLMQSVNQVQLKDNLRWPALIEQVLLRSRRIVCEGQHRSGRQMMVEMSPLNLVDESLAGIVFNLTDISLLKASEQRRTELLNFLSHDLRSPLASMLAMIELTKNKSSLEEVLPMLNEMESNTHKTLHIAEQFLQLSRANTPERLEFQDIDINSVVLNAMDQLWGLSQQSGVAIEYDFELEELWTQAEADLLERAVINLLSNALKHSASGQKVLARVRLQDGQIECCVIDKGSGIPADELPRLFEMFKRTRTSQLEQKKGTGLGLAFVDAVARRHSGYVKVSSKQGEGSRFCLVIPLNDQQNPDPADS